MFRGCDVPRLRSFVATAEQDHQYVSVLSEINPVPRTEIQPKIHDPVAHRFVVAEVTEPDPVEPDTYPGTRL